MIDFSLPPILTADFVALIPAQRATVNRLMEQGKIANYVLALNRSRLWAIVVATNEDEVLDVLSQFPLLKFVKFDIFPLAFHQSIPQGMPFISLN
ncbi:MAG: muconolactone Delta-isomerase family protein [Bacteroidia bacterium]